MPRNRTSREYQDETERLADEFAQYATRDILKPDHGLCVIEALERRPAHRPLGLSLEQRTRLLAQAELHVRAGERHIASQRSVVGRLESIGVDATLAKQLLKTFEDLQSLHILDRDRIAAEMASASKR